MKREKGELSTLSSDDKSDEEVEPPTESSTVTALAVIYEVEYQAPEWAWIG